MKWIEGEHRTLWNVNSYSRIFPGESTGCAGFPFTIFMETHEVHLRLAVFRDTAEVATAYENIRHFLDDPDLHFLRYDRLIMPRHRWHEN